jgi:hypothetical protein
MRQHELDPVSVFFGLVFAFVSGGYLLTHTTGVNLHWVLAVPAGLIVVGVCLLGYAVRRVKSAENAGEV